MLQPSGIVQACTAIPLPSLTVAYIFKNEKLYKETKKNTKDK
jgi:hypothetical protein